MTVYANKPTPTGRTSNFAISRPNANHVWRTAEPVIEKLHCFGKMTEAAPKHLYTKGAGDRDHVGRASSGLSAEVELHGEVGFSGLNSLLFAFFGSPDRVRSFADGAYLERFEVPLSPLNVFTLCEYDGAGRLKEIPSVMLTSFSLEAKSDGFFTWSMKGHGDRLRQDEKCFNSPVDVINATYASPAYADKYVAHDASEDSTFNSTFFGRTRLRKVPTPPNLTGTNFLAIDELPWSDFKLTIDLKANAIATQRRSKGFPAISDIPETKMDFTVPTEGDSVDTTHNWADLIDDAFLEGGNDDTPKFPIFNKLWMEICGPLIPGSTTQPFFMRILCPRLSTRCTNPTAASSGLEPIKAEVMALRGLREAPLQIPGNAPIYFFYQTDHDIPAVPATESTPVITAPVDDLSTSISGTTPGGPALDGTVISLYVNGLEFAQGVVSGGVGAWTITGLNLTTYLSKTITAKAGFGEGKSLASVGVIVT